MSHEKDVPSLKSRKSSLNLAKEFVFLLENGSSFLLNIYAPISQLFPNFRSWASFSLHFLIIQLILQPLITNGIITIIKIKTHFAFRHPVTPDLLKNCKDPIFKTQLSSFL